MDAQSEKDSGEEDTATEDREIAGDNAGSSRGARVGSKMQKGQVHQ